MVEILAQKMLTCFREHFVYSEYRQLICQAVRSYFFDC